MEKTYKRMSFDIELAKKIQSGKVEGRIVTDNGYSVRIICFDKRTSSGYPIIGLVDYPNQSEMCKTFNIYGLCYGQPVEYTLQIELPEEEPKHEFKPFDKVLVRCNNFNEWEPDFYWRKGIKNKWFNKLKDDYVTIEIYYTIGDKDGKREYKECIPYEGNEHLLGTTNNP